MKLRKSYIFPLFAAAGLLCACEDVFEPAPENKSELEAIYDSPRRAQGLIGQVYSMVDGLYPSTPQSDLATDDAVSNKTNNSYSVIAQGGWKSDYNPLSRWDNCYAAINYCNIFLDNADKITWVKADDVLNKYYSDRFKAEAYAYRAIFHYKLLEAHAGMVGGTLMGIPIHDKAESDGNFIQTRSTFKECVDFIMNDFNTALKYLPAQFGDIESQDDVPENIKQIMGDGKGEVNLSSYNRVYGTQNIGKIDGTIIKTIRSQFEFMVASPAYQSANTGIDWSVAAQDAAKVLADAGKTASSMDKDGWFWFDDSRVDNFKSLEGKSTHGEVLWHNYSENENRSLESDCYPPSIYGGGDINPTQNLVDAFPMENGYPITDVTNSGYDKNNPYAGRDPRLKKYILVNGDVLGNNSKTISVVMPATGESNIDANNQENGKSTKTGYYLKKLLRSKGVNLDPSSGVNAKHLVARIRYTEIFLNFAEAANEAVGPKALVGDASFSAYDVIKAIRERAGITDTRYLDECAGDKDKFRELIRNERRLELCFENKRFWDLRRWMVELPLLNENANGVTITENADKTLNFTYSEVERRDYKDYQYYGPIPYYECLKFSELTQNTGW